MTTRSNAIKHDTKEPKGIEQWYQHWSSISIQHRHISASFSFLKYMTYPVVSSHQPDINRSECTSNSFGMLSSNKVPHIYSVSQAHVVTGNKKLKVKNETTRLLMTNGLVVKIWTCNKHTRTSEKNSRIWSKAASTSYITVFNDINTVLLHLMLDPRCYNQIQQSYATV